MQTTFFTKRVITQLIFVFWLINSIFLIATLYLQKQRNKEDEKVESTLYAKLPSDKEKPKLKEKEPKTIKILKGIRLKTSQKLKTGLGTKSVVFDRQRKYLYAMNLEGMSIKVFDRNEKSLVKTLKFKPTRAKGYDYQKNKWFDSYAEKPVEACLTHEGRYLWISLHNAGGVVLWDLKKQKQLNGKEKISAKITDYLADSSYQVQLPFIATGKTPKFIASTTDNKYVFVSNWHDHTVSVIDTQNENPILWKVVKQLKASGVPRGLAVSHNNEKLYVAHMGKGFISVFDIKTLELDIKKYVGATPRHLLVDNQFLYVSLSSPEKILKLNQDSLTLINSVKTLDDPRTISFSNDSSLIVATCYADDKIQIFGKDSLNLLGSWESKGKPVGVDVFQQDSIVETWVCNYTNGNIKVFTFNAEFEEKLQTAYIK